MKKLLLITAFVLSFAVIAYAAWDGATNYPGALDDDASLYDVEDDGNVEDEHHDALAQAVIAIETKLGTGADTPAATDVMVGTGAGTSGWSADIPTAVTIGTGYIYRAGGTDVADVDVVDTLTITNISQVQDITASAAEINTPLDGASVTLTEFQELEAIGDTTISADQWALLGGTSVIATELAELETIGATTISANQWALLGGVSETLTNTELNYLDAITGKSGADTTLITGTAGTDGHYAVWDANGDVVDGEAVLAATHDTAAELNALYEGELTNSAGLRAALNDETGTGIAVFGTSPTFTTSALMANGSDIKVSTTTTAHEFSIQVYDNDDTTWRDALTFANGDSPSVTLGANVTLGGLGLITPAGGVASLTPVTGTAAGFAAGFTGANYYGGTYIVTNAGTIQLPVMAVGMNFKIITSGANAVVIDTNAADGYLHNGLTGTEGKHITNTSTCGDWAELQYYTADDWLITTNGWTPE